jgi:hypothetical protein
VAAQYAFDAVGLDGVKMPWRETAGAGFANQPGPQLSHRSAKHMLGGDWSWAYRYTFWVLVALRQAVVMVGRKLLQDGLERKHLWQVGQQAPRLACRDQMLLSLKPLAR